MSLVSRATWVKARFTNIASALSSKFCNWAVSNSIQPPYSSAHVLPREVASQASSQAHRSKIDEASPAPRAAPSPASRTPAPSMPVDRPLPTQRPPSPVSMYPVQDGFVRPASDCLSLANYLFLGPGSQFILFKLVPRLGVAILKGKVDTREHAEQSTS